MPRHFWISASIAVLVAAFALLALALPRLVMIDEELSSSGRSQDAQVVQVATYSVPPARGAAIKETLRTVLQQGTLGQADLAAPDRLVVSAPARMQGSIRKAIEELSGSDAGAAASPSPASASIEVWLVEATSTPAAADPRLAPASAALAEARARFGHAGHRLVDRSMTMARLDGSQVRIAGAGSSTMVQLLSSDGDAVEATIAVEQTISYGAREQGRMNSFLARMVLPPEQWQLIGLLPNGNASAPERLLLVRQTPVASRVHPEE